MLGLLFPIQVRAETELTRSPPTWLVIPKIQVDAPVKSAPLVDGLWKVPAFAVGHLEGTVNPDEVGLVGLSAHVESPYAGQIFARLNELEEGDEVQVTTETAIFHYVVVEKRVVEKTEVSVLVSSGKQLALITCIGDFDLEALDFSHRLLVIAEQVAEEERT